MIKEFIEGLSSFNLMFGIVITGLAYEAYRKRSSSKNKLIDRTIIGSIIVFGLIGLYLIISGSAFYLSFMYDIFVWIPQNLVTFFTALTALGAMASAHYSREAIEQGRRPLLKFDIDTSHASISEGVIEDTPKLVQSRKLVLRLENKSENPAFGINLDIASQDTVQSKLSKLERIDVKGFTIESVYRNEPRNLDLTNEIIAKVLIPRKLVEIQNIQSEKLIVPTQDLFFYVEITGGYKSDTGRWYTLPETRYDIEWKKGDRLMLIKSNDVLGWARFTAEEFAKERDFKEQLQQPKN